MRRHVLTAAAMGSVVLFGVTVVVWVRSGWVETYAWAGAPGPGSAVVVVERGEVLVITCGGWPRGSAWQVKSEGISSASSYSPGIAPDVRNVSGNWSFDVPGVEVLSQRGWLILPRAAGTVSTSMPTAQVTLTRVGLWGPVVLFGILPLVWGVVRLRARLKRKAGCCARCGYDLTGNTSGVCPECGAKLLHREKVL